MEIGLSAIPGSEIIDVVKGIDQGDYVAVGLGIGSLAATAFGLKPFSVAGKALLKIRIAFKVVRALGKNAKFAKSLLNKGFKFDIINSRLVIKKGKTIVANGDDVGRVANNLLKGMPSDFIMSLKRILSTQKQARHIKGPKEYIRSGSKGSYFNNQNNAQKVLNAIHSGEAKFIKSTKTGNQIFKYDGVKGFNNNPGAGFLDQPTNISIIKGTSSPSIVPTSPI